MGGRGILHACILPDLRDSWVFHSGCIHLSVTWRSQDSEHVWSIWGKRSSKKPIEQDYSDLLTSLFLCSWASCVVCNFVCCIYRASEMGDFKEVSKKIRKLIRSYSFTKVKMAQYFHFQCASSFLLCADIDNW